MVTIKKEIKVFVNTWFERPTNDAKYRCFIIDKKVEQLHEESMRYLKVFNETNDIRYKNMYDTLQYAARKVNEIIEEIEAT